MAHACCVTEYVCVACYCPLQWACVSVCQPQWVHVMNGAAHSKAIIHAESRPSRALAALGGAAVVCCSALGGAAVVCCSAPVVVDNGFPSHDPSSASVTSNANCIVGLRQKCRWEDRVGGTNWRILTLISAQRCRCTPILPSRFLHALPDQLITNQCNYTYWF